MKVESGVTMEQNKEIVRRQFQLISEGKARDAAALYAPVSRNHGREVDREGMTRVFESLIAVKEKFALHEMVAEGDWVACRATVTGRHDAKPAMPVDSGIHSVVEPTGLTYTFQHIHLFRIANGQIVEHWANRDDLGAAARP